MIGFCRFCFWALLVALLLPGCSTLEPTLDEKIGQLLMVGFRGTTVDENHAIAEDIQQRHLGGVILFDYDLLSGEHKRNIASPEQLAALVSALQELSSAPLLIAVDQEGGRVARLKTRYGFPPTRSHRELGEKGDLQLTLNETSRLAGVLAESGIGMNMAPVVDLCSNPANPVIARLDRCFSADPLQVTAQSRSYIAAHRQQGVLTVLKHFPGHGSSQQDSHLGMTDVSASWSESELIPYRQLISEGQVDAVMTAHVFNARLDERYPATLSRATITGVLRQQLGFDGVVISDDLQMKAIVDQYGFETAIGKALQAGADILLFGNNLEYDEQVVSRAVAVIEALVARGELSAAQIDNSYRRVMQLKSRLKSI